MDPLYKIIKQLSPEEFEDIYQNLTSNKADKSALFLRTIRESENPVEDFLEKQEISASAFYVLKSRLNQKVESFLLNRLGDPKMEAIHKVFKVYDLIFNSPREISVTTLKRLEKAMIDMDNPMVLMVVYRALKMLHNTDDEQRSEYDSLYNQAVAFFMANEKAMENVMVFFRLYDRYVLGRREKDFNDLMRVVEKLDNINHLYDSQRLYICKAIVHLFARLFLDLPARVLEIMEPEEQMFEKAFGILERNKEDILFKNINLIFDFLRFAFYNRAGSVDRARIYFELLDYKIEDLLNNFNFGMDCSAILFFKLDRHLREWNLKGLQEDTQEYIARIEVDPNRLVTSLNFHLYQAYVAYFNRDYEGASRVLFRFRNKVNLRKYAHSDLEIKLFLAYTYVLQDETDLANQLILSLQRQVKKGNYDEYENARIFLKILTSRLSGKSAKRAAQIQKLIQDYKAVNTGRVALLPQLDLEFALLNGLD